MGIIKPRKVKTLSFDFKEHKEDRVTYRWTSSSGAKTYVADMPIQYLVNSINMLKEGRNRLNEYSILEILEKELEYKKLLKFTKNE